MKKLLIVLLASLMYFNTVTCVNINAQAFTDSKKETALVNSNTYYEEEDPVIEDTPEVVLEEGEGEAPEYHIVDDATGDNLWSFDAYYIDEETPYYAHKTGDKFNLIYQLEFHTETTIPKNALRITIPSVLLKDRYNNEIKPDDIAVPKASNPVYNSLGLLESIDFTPTKNIGFNYYTEIIDGVEYLVFFNYRDLAVGTSAAIQVLYKNLQVMDLVDDSKWTLPVTIDGYFPDKNDEYTYIHQSIDNQPLTGNIDSHNTLTASTKIPYDDESKSYTPELYTKRQVDAYITYKDPDNYNTCVVANFDNTSDDYSTYRYAVWESSVKITDANQPYYVDIRENLPNGAKVVGISSGNGNQPLGVKKVTKGSDPVYESDETFDIYRIWDNHSLQEKYYDQQKGYAYQKEKNITYTNVRIVVAYPKDQFDNFNGPYKLDGANAWDVTNEIEVIVTPIDGKDPVQSKIVSSEFPYQEYVYGYGGNGWSTSKSDGGSYNGWSNAYVSRSKEGKDLGGIPFSYAASSQYYDHTHYVNSNGGHTPGEAIPDSYIRVTAVDDLIYISDKKGGMDLREGHYELLGRDDYYYNYVDVVIDDYGYDVFEDTTSRNDATYINKSTKIYAMYEDTIGEVWEEVKVYDTSKDYSQKYVFSADELARHPYRVMAIHESNGYSQSVRINVNVSLKGTSETVKKYICVEGASNNSANSVTLENNGGVIIESVSGADSLIINNNNPIADVSNKNQSPINKNNVTYVKNDSQDLGLYSHAPNTQTNGVEPLRYRSWRTGWSPYTQGHAYLNNANPIARTFKNATVSNDTVNARINVSYSLIAYNGYDIYSESVISYMKSTGNDFTGHNEMVFYDLLPLGVEFDPSVPIVAGRLTDANEKQIFKYTNAWDKKNVTVDVDPDRDVVTNFNGTGRTLVIFHLKYKGSDSTVFTESRDINNAVRKLWIEGYGINYGAYYTWENIGLVENGSSYNVFAYTTDKNELKKDLVGKGLGESLSSIETYVYNVDQSNKTIAGSDDGKYPGLDYSDLIAASLDGRSDIWSDSSETDPAKKNSTFTEIVFGKGSVTDIYAKSSQAEIIKGVRADSDSFGAFDYQAEVKLGEPYSYEITIKTSGAELEQIIVYDHLENTLDEDVKIKVGDSIVDKKYVDVVNDPNTASKLSAKFAIDPVETIIDETKEESDPSRVTNIYNSWYGTFNGINKKSLDLQGIAAIIYYSTNRNATIPNQSEDFDSLYRFSYSATDLTDEEKKAEVKEAMEDGMWVSEEIFLANGYTLADVRSYAIDMRKKKDGSAFVLPKMSSVSFRSSMISPSEMQTMTEGLSDDQISRKDPDRSAEWSYNNAAYSSSMGSLDTTTLTSNPVRIRQVENDRLIVTKNVNKEVEVPENFKGVKFDFTLSYRMNSNDAYAPFANKYYELWEYDTASSSWIKLVNTIHATDVDGKFQLKDNQRAVFRISDQTDYQIKEDESPYWKQDIVTPDTSDEDNNPVTVNPDTNNQYREYYYDFENTFRPFMYITKKVSDYGTLDISDISFNFTLYKKNDDGTYEPAANREYWKVSRPFTDATTPEKIDAASYYTDEDGNFTIKANETVCMFAGLKNDTFKVVENIDEDSDWVLISDNFKECRLDIMNNIIEFKNRYRLRDLYITKTLTHFNEETSEDAFTFKVVENVNEDGTVVGKPLSGNRYYILDEAKKKITLDDEKTLDPLYTGTLSPEGTFTAPVGNKTVLIEGLEYSKSYTVSELTADDGTALVNDKASEWRPLNTASDVTMPIYSMSKEVSFTNDYLLRPLEVTKTVVSKTAVDPSIEYVMRAYIETETETPAGDKVKEYKLLTNKPFTSTDSNREVLETDDDGTFTIKGSETVKFDYLARTGTKFKVEELWNGHYVQIYPQQKANTAGHPVHEDGTELKLDEEYQTPLLGSIAMEGGKALIINGENGVLLVGKEYHSDSEDETATTYLNQLRTFVESDDTYNSSSEAVTLTLKIMPAEIESDTETSDPTANQLYTWPKEEGDYTVFNLVSNTTGTIHLNANEPFKLNPWIRVLVSLDKGDTYILSESESDSSKMYLAKDKVVNSEGFIDIEAVEETINGNPELNPIATIVNNISSHTVKSSVMKYMKPASDPVVEGSEIVFKVERYNSGLWSPASDIKYVVTEYDSTIDAEYMTSPLTEEDLYFVSESVKTTDSSGKISYIKNTKNNISLYPRINFIEDTVYTQLPEGKENWTDGDLRVVELTNESSTSWGQWYSNTQSSTPQKTDSMISNSNRTVQMELRKKLAEDEVDDGRSYTFILNQVMSFKNGKPDQSVSGAGLPYIVYDAEGNVVDTRVTNANGEATLKAFETARFNLADGTNWTFSEVQDSVYKLDRDVEVDDGDYSSKLESNLALVGIVAPKIPVLLTAVPNKYKAITSGGSLVNTFTVTVYYSDETSKVLTSGYNRTDTKNPDNSWNVHFDYTESDITVSSDVHLTGTAPAYVKNYDYTGSVQEFIAPQDGLYFFEAWGAQGGDFISRNSKGVDTNNYYGGKGAYTSGYVYLKKDDKVYVYVGGSGNNDGIYKTPTNKEQTGNGHYGGFNGGGRVNAVDDSGNNDDQAKYGAPGGGATDFRLKKASDLGSNYLNNMDPSDVNIESYQSRIMVAAGGGGANNRSNIESIKDYGAGDGGYGGEEVGGNGQLKPGTVPGQKYADYDRWYGTGGTQKEGGQKYNNTTSSIISSTVVGRFLYGGIGQSGGGGGYYGGAGSSHGGAGGGSSYINGDSRCDDTYRLEDYKFTNGVMIAGNKPMVQPDGSYDPNVLGHSGNGYARVTLVEQDVKSFGFTGEVQEFTANKAGYYKLEAWGAQGGATSNGEFANYQGGAGAYTSGLIYLNVGDTLYVYVGGQGENGGWGTTNPVAQGGWNGGGNGSYGYNKGNGDDWNYNGGAGGGATDFRLKRDDSDTVWNNEDSLNSRIMVAAAGSGSQGWLHNDNKSRPASYPGGEQTGYPILDKSALSTSDVRRYYATGGKQNVAGEFGGAENPNQAVWWSDSTDARGTDGGFGFGGDSCIYHGAGGGGGYYGGGGGGWYTRVVVSGGSGSSYINGYEEECATTNEEFKITSGVMIGGDKTMPQPGGTSSTGHLGDGAARVTYVGELSTVIEYSGSVEEYVAPSSGYYKLEAWGAQGGSVSSPDGTVLAGGKGGYSCGTVYLEKNQKIYVTVGGQGKTLIKDNAKLAQKADTVKTTHIDGLTRISGGFNGGGAAGLIWTTVGENSEFEQYGSGGGATSFETAKLGNGELRDYLVDKNKVLLVAGGGGGSSYYNAFSETFRRAGYGGSGGGLTGGKVHKTLGNNRWVPEDQQVPAGQTPVTGTIQDKINALSEQGFGMGANGDTTGSYGKEDNRIGQGAGGGGGWYGGRGLDYGADGQYFVYTAYGAGGGSGHINENLVFNGKTIGGDSWSDYVHDGDKSTVGNEGNGMARITYLGEPSYVEHGGLRTSKGGYIDTGYVANENTRISVTYKYDKNTKGFVYGSRGGDKDFMLGDASGSDDEHFIYWYPGCTGGNRWIKSKIIETGVKYKFTTAQDNQSATLEGIGDPVVIPNNSTSRAISGNTIYLFWMNKDIERWLMDGVIYEFKVYENGNLVRNYVPVEEENSGAYGMLDTVNNVFYPGLGGQNHFSFEN